MPENSDAEIVAQRDEQDVDRDDWTPPVAEPEDGTDEEVQ